MIKLNAKQLRKGTGYSLREASRVQSTVKRNEIYIVLDNVLDTYNVGSIFRLADAVAAKKVYLCGATETPPNHRIKKASINTTEVVDWEYAETAVSAISNLKLFYKLPSAEQISNIQIVAIEQAATAVPYNEFEYKLPICLVVGHETEGVSKEVLEIADAVVELPMFGVNISLNVMVSLGIILYKVIEKTKLIGG